MPWLKPQEDVIKVIQEEYHFVVMVFRADLPTMGEAGDQCKQGYQGIRNVRQAATGRRFDRVMRGVMQLRRITREM